MRIRFNVIKSLLLVISLAFLPNNLAVATGGTIENFSANEVSTGVIDVSGSASGAETIKITIYQEDGTTEVADIITPVNPNDNTFASAITIMDPATYVVSATDADGGDAKTAKVTLSGVPGSTTDDPTKSSIEPYKIIIAVAIIAVLVAGLAFGVFLALRRRRKITKPSANTTAPVSATTAAATKTTSRRRRSLPKLKRSKKNK